MTNSTNTVVESGCPCKFPEITYKTISSEKICRENFPIFYELCKEKSSTRTNNVVLTEDFINVFKETIDNKDKLPKSANNDTINGLHYNSDTYELERSFGMDNNFLEMYIQKLNEDQNQLRNDIRASEERTAKLIEHLDQSLDKKIDRITNSIDEIDKKLDSKVEQLETKIDGNNKHIQNITYANMGVMVAVIGLIIAVIIGVTQILQGFEIDSAELNESVIATYEINNNLEL